MIGIGGVTVILIS